jgi:hypothetical protein
MSVDELGDGAHGERFDHCEGPVSVVWAEGGDSCMEILSVSLKSLLVLGCWSCVLANFVVDHFNVFFLNQGDSLFLSQS